jgi:hypothetical protein
MTSINKPLFQGAATPHEQPAQGSRQGAVYRRFGASKD